MVSAFISLYKKQREDLKLSIPDFIEVFVNIPLEVCKERDKNGLYTKASAGEIKKITGISDPYYAPEKPDIELFTIEATIEENAQKVVTYLYENQFLIKKTITVSDIEVVEGVGRKGTVGLQFFLI